MRILLVSYEYPPVGAGAATAGGAMAKALIELGHRVVVLTGRFKGLPPRYEDHGIIIHRVPSLRRRMDRSDVVEMASFLASGLMFVPTIIRTHRVEGADWSAQPMDRRSSLHHFPTRRRRPRHRTLP